MPVLFGSMGDGAREVEVRAASSSTVPSSSTTAQPADTSADELLDSTSVTGLLRAGPRDSSADDLGTVERFLGTTGTGPAGSPSNRTGAGASPALDHLSGSGTDPDGATTDPTGERAVTPADGDDAESSSAESGDDRTSDPVPETTSRASEPEDAEPNRPAPTTTPPAPPEPAPTAPPSAPPTAPPTTPPTGGSEPAGGEPTAAQWEALRQCEAWGDYTVVSGNGKYSGAYQFSQGTWDNIARLSGRSDLVGVRPSDASPADQDALALALWRSSGWSSWPSCGKKAAVA